MHTLESLSPSETHAEPVARRTWYKAHSHSAHSPPPCTRMITTIREQVWPRRLGVVSSHKRVTHSASCRPLVLRLFRGRFVDCLSASPILLSCTEQSRAANMCFANGMRASPETRSQAIVPEPVTRSGSWPLSRDTLVCVALATSMVTPCSSQTRPLTLTHTHRHTLTHTDGTVS